MISLIILNLAICNDIVLRMSYVVYVRFLNFNFKITSFPYFKNYILSVNISGFYKINMVDIYNLSNSIAGLEVKRV